MRYLEISARQTGKTSRLISAVLELLKKGENCVIHTHGIATSMAIKQHIDPELHRYLYVIPGEQDKIDKAMDEGALNWHWAYHFYDEFDFILQKSVKEKNVYFVTTPARIRKEASKSDFLFQVIKDIGTVVTYTNPDVYRPMIDYLKTLSIDQYKREILAKYFEPEVNV